MTRGIIVHIERAEGEPGYVNTGQVRHLYTSLRGQFRAVWPIEIAPSTDRLLLVETEVDPEKQTVSQHLNDLAESPEAAVIYPNGVLYAFGEAADLARKGRKPFAGKEADLERLMQENAEIVAVTQHGAVKAFHKERDVILTLNTTREWTDRTAEHLARATISYEP